MLRIAHVSDVHVLEMRPPGGASYGTLGEAWLFPLDVSFPQPIARAAGMFTEHAARRLGARLADDALAKRPQIVVQHHPPHPRIVRAWDWVDGLRGGDRMLTC